MIAQRLYARADLHGDREFLVYEDRIISYAEMARLVTGYVGYLQAHGIRPGERVVVICGNRPAFLVAWFALATLGATMVPLNPGLTAGGFKSAVDRSDAKALLVDDEYLQAHSAEHFGAQGDIPVLRLNTAVELDRASGPPVRRSDCADPTELCTILFTSGTTGVPKGAQISHASYAAAAVDMAAALELSADDRIMVFLPLFHANAQMYAVLPALEVGCTLVLSKRFSASRFFSEARRHRATGFTYVGSVLNLIEKSNPGEMRDHLLQWCVGGGAPKRIWREIESRYGIAVRELYGMTETGGWITMNTRHETKIGSVGRPRVRVGVRVVDSAGRSLPANQLGEIVAQSERSSVFFEGYLNDPGATAETLRGSWLHTGDRGWLDTEGYLYFDGRIKELIRRSGEMIAPAEIELELLKHRSVSDCAALGVPDEVMGEEIEILVVPNGHFDVAEICSFLRESLPRHMWPRYLSIVTHIPRTETHKLKRHELSVIARDTVDLPIGPERKD